MSVKPIQKILFGSPGTGKSHKIQEIAQADLNISFDETAKSLKNTVKTVFHPEYTYADFIGKLMPQSQGNAVLYKFHPGHFLRALSVAYRAISNGSNEHALLVIDELNRGNAAAIFGTVFQLLDRDSDGWSSYEVDLSDLEIFALLGLMGYKPSISDNVITVEYKPLEKFCSDEAQKLHMVSNEAGARLFRLLSGNKISIPSNLSILATINTSDESIYYLDSAFKRRWDWEYIESPLDVELAPAALLDVGLVVDENNTLSWAHWIVRLNQFIRSHHQSIRRIEDKQVGWWFIKSEAGKVQLQQVKDKLLFYLWDNVFAKDRRPLKTAIEKQLEAEIDLITFADFVAQSEAFINYIAMINL